MHPVTRMIAGAVAVGLFSGGTLAAEEGARSPGQVADDAAITASVKTRLTADSTTKARQINVETSSGVVQLNGFVDTGAAKAEAGRLARQVDGVQEVENNLEVRELARSPGQVIDDGALTARVNASLAADPRTSALTVDVESNRGEIQLSGFAKSAAEKAAAADVAESVEGVKTVKNNLDVR